MGHLLSCSEFSVNVSEQEQSLVAVEIVKLNAQRSGADKREALSWRDLAGVSLAEKMSSLLDSEFL